MQWQDNIRDLDEQLAAGDIDIAEHRRLRDEALAEAASGTNRRTTSSAFLPQRTAGQQRRTQVDQPQTDGEAVFTEQPKRRIGVIAVGVVVVAAAVGAGVWLFSGDKAEEKPQAEATAAEKLAKQFPALPGTVWSPPTVLPVTVGVQLDLYGSDLSAKGSTGLVNAASTDGPRSLTVNALDNGGGPDRAVDALRYAIDEGWLTESAPNDVQLVRTGRGGVQYLRAIYQSGNWTVLVTVESTKVDKDLRAYLDTVLAKTEAALPAG